MKVNSGLGLVAVVVIGIAIVGLIALELNQPPSVYPPGNVNRTEVIGLKSFNSWDNVTSFLQAAQAGRGRGYYGMLEKGAVPLMATAQAPTGAPAPSADTSSTVGGQTPDHSTTNVQVAGVDEADVLKNDGKYLYTVSNGNIVILLAYPAANSQVLSAINGSKNGKQETYSEIFVAGDKLVAFGTSSFDWQPIIEKINPATANSSTGNAPSGKIAAVAGGMMIRPYPYYYQQSSFIKVFDISNRSNPIEVKRIETRGSYVTSRLIGSKVYTIITESAYADIPRPLYAVDGVLSKIAPSEISYFDEPFDNYDFTTVLGIDLDDLQKEENRKIVLTGGGQTIFVSQQNAYITYTKYNYYFPTWDIYKQMLNSQLQLDNATLEKLNAIDASDASDWRKENLKIAAINTYVDSLNETQRNAFYDAFYKAQNQAEQNYVQPGETTQIHKFALGNDNSNGGTAITYEGKGSVPGHVLNQFSMDEFNGNFRVATTIGQVWRNNNQQTPATNNVYVLNSSLSVVGKIEKLAPGETIYSARFMGNKAYLVTFKKVDPLFVIGLEDPTNPTLLGKLKIPGYSEYLHPIDENHLIGLGKDAVPAEEGDFAWYQGVKLAIFDVSDVANPREMYTYSIGDRGTDSYALNDHRAFLYSKDRNLLVLPITLAIVNKSQYANPSPRDYGTYTFQGAYVFNVSLESGFNLRGTISHANPEDLAKSGEYYYGWGGTDVKRSAYIGNMLYTVSDSKVKANDLDTLEEKANVKLPYDAPVYYPYDDMMVR